MLSGLYNEDSCDFYPLFCIIRISKEILTEMYIYQKRNKEKNAHHVFVEQFHVINWIDN